MNQEVQAVLIESIKVHDPITGEQKVVEHRRSSLGDSYRFSGELMRFETDNGLEELYLVRIDLKTFEETRRISKIKRTWIAL